MRSRLWFKPFATILQCNWLSRFHLRNRCGVVGLGCVLLLASCKGLLSPAQVPPPTNEGVPKQLLQRQVIVTLAPASANQWSHMTDGLAQTYDLPKVGAFPLGSIGVQCIVFQIPANRSLPDMVAKLAADPRVETVQINQFFQSQERIYNDPYANLQYGARAVRAALVHSTTTGKGVKVAVIDTGVDTEHPDLRSRVVTTENFVAGGQTTFVQDRHGTAVSGVIAAQADNKIGIFGVAPEAEIIALKACWHRSATTPQALCSSWTLARAIDFAIQQHAQVLNFSLAGPPDPLLERLLVKSTAEGITVVAATLDPSQGLGFPASLDTVIAVLTSDTMGKVRFPSLSSHTKLLAAPGVDIVTTLPKGTYDALSGSSLAAAHVSGIVALLLERNPALSPAQLHDVLQTSAQPLPTPDNTVQAKIGLVDACAALEHLRHIASCP